MQFVAYGKVKYRCEGCKTVHSIYADMAEFDQDGGDDRGMGPEALHIWEWSDDCRNPKCDLTHSLTITISEYPSGVFNHETTDSDNVTDVEWPAVECVHNYYDLRDDVAVEVERSIQEVIEALQANPERVRDLDDRVFEELVAELFRNAGFEVELTARTKDGGKDIIAIQKSVLGVETKLFVECKRYAENVKVGVALVRALYGVFSERDGPNKSLLVTTSSFTSGALDFAAEKTTSKWDLELVDFNKLVTWIRQYASPSSTRA